MGFPPKFFKTTLLKLRASFGFFNNKYFWKSSNENICNSKILFKKPKLLYVCDRTFIALNILFSAPFFSKHTNFFIIGSYVYACAWASFPMLGWGEYGVEAYGTSCTLKWTENRGFVTLMLISCIIFPVIIMKFCYGGVYLYLRRHCKAFRTDRSKMGINVRKREGYLIKVSISFWNSGLVLI